ncbi:hypothetical protein [Nocardioides panacisoli]|uniref:Integral membrane protein n=1 Tax=Nocardioides panacisoli TaxID=627624 RepID=A0ABP7I1Y0_9ACTN
MGRGTIVLVGAIVALLGAIFTLQGIGTLQGSPMSDTTTWSVAGPVIVVVGLVLILFGLRRPR